MGRFFALGRHSARYINLSLGEPDFVVPKDALDRGFEEAFRGKTHYAPTNGIAELREALVKKAYTEYGLRYDPDTEVLVTVGASEAIFLALCSFVNHNNEVLISNPGFVAYEPCVALSRGKTVGFPLREENDFRPSICDVTSLLTAKSRVMLLNFPNNPTGSVLTHDDAHLLAKTAVEKNLLVISDEVYEKIVYDEMRNECMATFPGMRERTLVVGSFSKTYAMTGLRVGYVYGPKDLIAPLWKLHQYLVSSVDSLAQYIGLAALTKSQQLVHKMVRGFNRRRDLVHKRLNEIDGIRCAQPKGAFYVFPNISTFKKSSEHFADLLRDKAGVITVPGSFFGNSGEGYIRLA